METIQVRITPKAREALDELATLLAKEKGLSEVTLTDAASIAILEAVERRQSSEKQE